MKLSEEIEKTGIPLDLIPRIKELERKAALWIKLGSSPPGYRFTRDDETWLWYQDRIAWGCLPTPEHPTQYATLEEALNQIPGERK